MAGYMGFGMATWIYRQGPRKAFSKGRSKPSCNTLPTYQRQFKLQPSENKSQISEILSCLLIGLFLISMYFKASEVVTYSLDVQKQKETRIKTTNQEAFQFLMRSGLKRLNDQNMTGAYSEFNLAYQIQPDNEQLQQLMIEVLSTLCDNNNDYCLELDQHLNSSLQP
ncbi:hypothetical protein ACU8DI_05490 [Psychroserpens sp. BH13MA-6]